MFSTLQITPLGKKAQCENTVLESVEFVKPSDKHCKVIQLHPSATLLAFLQWVSSPHYTPE